MPADERAGAWIVRDRAEGDGEPGVAGVGEIAGLPDVGHEDEGILLAGDGKDEGALGAESGFGVFALAGVAEFFPAAEDAVADGGACFVGGPAAASGGD